MKIIELRAENVKRLHAVQVTPEGSVVVVGGKNGAGKSSLLDSIVYALAGAASLPGKPVRKGEEHAEIELTLDGEPNLVVRRRIRDDGKTDLEIRQVDANGKATAKLSKPQDVLDKLCGTIAFDPLAFTKLKRPEQAAMLRELVGVTVDDLDATEARLYDERTAVNRDVKRLEAQIDGLPLHKDAPEIEVSAREILEQIEAIRRHNENCAAACEAEHDALGLVERAESLLLDAKQKVILLEEALESARQQEKRVAQQLAERKAAHEEADAYANSLERKDASPLLASLESIEATNAKVRQNAERSRLVEQASAAAEQADDLTRQIDDCRAERLNRLAAAKWPVEGLAFGDAGVTLNGLPFDQCSSAEQLRISTAIGLAQHPQLRVLLIRDGSLLDEDNLAAIAELASEHEAQVWIERVGKGEECSVIIEDGSVAATPKAKSRQKELA